MIRYGYNTNGLTSHRLDEALQVIAELGYGAVSLTPDVGALDPYRPRAGEVEETRARLVDLGLACAVETGARFVLDPRRKHRPSLLEDDARERGRRLDFLRRSVDLAERLGAGVVSIWAGSAPEGVGGTLDEDPTHPLGERLASGLESLLAHGAGAGVRIALEPEPGMFIERPDGFAALLDLMGERAAGLGLTLDTGHCVVTGDLPVADVLARFPRRLAHVHLADCPVGRHVHLPLGEGDLDLSRALGDLGAAGFDGIAAVELSRDSHRGYEAAKAALAEIRSRAPSRTDS